MWYTALKNLSKCFSTALVSYEAALLDGLSITATVVKLNDISHVVQQVS